MTKPISSVRAGALDCSLWENEVEKDGKVLTFKNVTLKRSYKDGDEWKSNSLSIELNNIPKAILVLDAIYKEAVLKKQEISKEPEYKNEFNSEEKFPVEKLEEIPEEATI